MWSYLWCSLCHVINSSFALFLNKCFKHGIIGKYHITFARTFASWEVCPQEHQDLHLSRSYNLALTLISDAIISVGMDLLILQPRGHIIYFASYVLDGNSLFSGSLFFTILGIPSNALPDTTCFALHYNISGEVPSFLTLSAIWVKQFSVIFYHMLQLFLFFIIFAVPMCIL
jgi:hypothetical protein